MAGAKRLHAVTPSKTDAGPAPVPLVARAVRRLKPYDPTTSLGDILGRRVETPYKLDWNESTIPPSPKVLEQITRFLGNSHHLNWYPELSSRRLLGSLAGYTGVPESHLLATNGSDDALALVCNTFLDPAEEVVVPTPTYTHFLVFAQAKSGRIVDVTFEDPFAVDVDRVIGAITPRTKLIYLVSPNNPTGSVYTREQVERILDHAPHAVVIVDEAYYECFGESVIDLTQTRANLVVTRTFSKAFGVAGLRVGYLAANPALLHELRRVFNPKSVNVLGQIAARAALSDLPYLRAYVDEVNAAKPMLLEYFASRGIEARTTPANYVLFKVPDPKRLCHELQLEGVYVRDRSMFPQLSGWIRMSVGTRDQTREVLARFDKVLG